VVFEHHGSRGKTGALDGEKMLGDWQIAHVSEPQRFVLYAKAYLQSSQALCREMVEKERYRSWPNAAVVLLLAAHSVELFLKGAILGRDPKANIAHHHISKLVQQYESLFKEPEFELEVPFRTEYLDISEEEIEALKKREPVPSVMFRYPVASPGVEWHGLHALEPLGFLEILDNLEKAYARIGDAI
jgi:hypothetical protein